MITVTFKELLDSKQSLEKIMTAELPVKIIYQYMQLSEEIIEKLRTFDGIKNKLLEKYAKLDAANPTQFKFESEENMNGFKKEFEELLNMELRFNVEPIPVALFEDSFKLSMIDIANLKKFIKS